MKQFYFFAVLGMLACTSCEKGDDINILTTLTGENGFNYTESLKEWNTLKTSHGASYSYETTFTSWTGFKKSTVISVEDGKVTGRSYREYRMNGNSGEYHLIDSYDERNTSLDTHTKGASPLTIDELYENCAEEYLTANSQNNTIYFETIPSGIMSMCGYTENSCVDDCYSGIRLTGFEWLK